MAGKIIVKAPTEHIGSLKMSIYINGIEQVQTLSASMTCEFDIAGDSQIYGVVSTWKSNVVCVKNNTYTELQFTKINRVFNSTLEVSIVKEELVDDVVNKSEKQELVDDVVNKSEKQEEQDAIVYDLKGARGRRLLVYHDRCIIATKAGVGSLITGNASDGEKTIYYTDVLSVQYKKCGLQLGYLQLETASSTMNNKSNNFFNENSFTFDANLSAVMEKVQEFVKKKVADAKKQKNTPIVVSGAISSADELKKFKELLDMGIITQEEFDAKKKQLLGL